MLNEPEGALHATDEVSIAVALAIDMECVVEQTVVSVTVTTGEGITVTSIESFTLAHGELAIPVSISFTVPDVIEGGV